MFCRRQLFPPPVRNTLRRPPACSSGEQRAQRTIHRLVDQGALNRMEARIFANPSLMTIQRCTVEHPFGTIKPMLGGGRFLTRELKAVKAEGALHSCLQHPPCRERLRRHGVQAELSGSLASRQQYSAAASRVLAQPPPQRPQRSTFAIAGAQIRAPAHPPLRLY